MAGRPFVFPDPNDRSPNDPSIIVSTEQILGIYNQDCNPATTVNRRLV